MRSSPKTQCATTTASTPSFVDALTISAHYRVPGIVLIPPTSLFLLGVTPCLTHPVCPACSSPVPATTSRHHTIPRLCSSQCRTSSTKLRRTPSSSTAVQQEPTPTLLVLDNTYSISRLRSIEPTGRSTAGPLAPIRNKQMVELGADLCLAFPDHPKGHGSRGTWNCIDLAQQAGIPVLVVWNQRLWVYNPNHPTHGTYRALDPYIP